MAYIGERGVPHPPPPSLLTPPGKDSGFVTSWLRIKGLRELCAVFEGIYLFFMTHALNVFTTEYNPRFLVSSIEVTTTGRTFCLLIKMLKSAR